MGLIVKWKRLRETAVMPVRATGGSAAYDLYAALDDEVVIAPGGRAMIPTGFAMSAADDTAPGTPARDFAALIFGRSGLGTKYGVTLANAVGVVDSDYRGEICVSLINHGGEPFSVHPGDRMAQMMFVPVIAAVFEEAESLDETARGTGGFGSTGSR